MMKLVTDSAQVVNFVYDALNFKMAALAIGDTDNPNLLWPNVFNFAVRLCDVAIAATYGMIALIPSRKSDSYDMLSSFKSVQVLSKTALLGIECYRHYVEVEGGRNLRERVGFLEKGLLCPLTDLARVFIERQFFEESMYLARHAENPHYLRPVFSYVRDPSHEIYRVDTTHKKFDTDESLSTLQTLRLCYLVVTTVRIASESGLITRLVLHRCPMTTRQLMNIAAAIAQCVRNCWPWMGWGREHDEPVPQNPAPTNYHLTINNNLTIIINTEPHHQGPPPYENHRQQQPPPYENHRQQPPPPYAEIAMAQTPGGRWVPQWTLNGDVIQRFLDLNRNLLELDFIPDFLHQDAILSQYRCNLTQRPIRYAVADLARVLYERAVAEEEHYRLIVGFVQPSDIQTIIDNRLRNLQILLTENAREMRR